MMRDGLTTVAILGTNGLQFIIKATVLASLLHLAYLTF